MAFRSYELRIVETPSKCLKYHNKIKIILGLRQMFGISLPDAKRIAESIEAPTTFLISKNNEEALKNLRDGGWIANIEAVN